MRFLVDQNSFFDHTAKMLNRLLNQIRKHDTSSQNVHVKLSFATDNELELTQKRKRHIQNLCFICKTTIHICILLVMHFISSQLMNDNNKLKQPERDFVVCMKIPQFELHIETYLPWDPNAFFLVHTMTNVHIQEFQPTTSHTNEVHILQKFFPSIENKVLDAIEFLIT